MTLDRIAITQPRLDMEPKRRRRSVRLKGHDYRQGAYFVTLCTAGRALHFGEVAEDGTMQQNPIGQLAGAFWRQIPDHFPHVTLDEFVVMPNHVHGILELIESGSATHPIVGRTHRVLLRRFGEAIPASLPTIIRAYKAAVTARVNGLSGGKAAPLWQRGYHEHIIRSEGELSRLRHYIVTNPLRWSIDRENPAGRPTRPIR